MDTMELTPPIDLNKATDPAPAPQLLRFSFKASGSEYFRIWIVNLLLCIVTLGIYAAWAKVRRTRYFYASTELAGSSFEYHGNPVAILKGRIIAFLLFGAYNLAFRVSPRAGVAMLVVMAALLPWLIWKSLQFKLYNSSYRGIRFGFAGSAKQAYFNFLWLPLVSLCTLYLLLPFTHHRIKRFQHNESSFGGSKFSFHAGVGGFYKAYGVLVLMYLVGIAVLLGGLAALGGGMLGLMKNPKTSLLLVACIYLLMFTIYPLFMVMIQNRIWNNTRLERHAFQSNLKWGRLMFIFVTNLVAIVCTLGLFIPFAQVRAMRYRLESTALLAHGSLDEFVANTSQQVGATGEGMADLLGFDLSM